MEGVNESMDRKTKVINKLTTLLKELKRTEPYLRGLEDDKNDDVYMLYVAGKRLEIKRLAREIENYQSDGHFTKQYRILEGHCGKLQTDLDKIDVFGRDDVKAARKEALLQVDGLLQALSKKAHSDGKPCKKCEIQS